MAKILQIGNYPPPACGWAVQTKLLVEEIRRRGHICDVLNINENRRIKSSEYIDVQNGFDYLYKLVRFAAQGYRFQVHVNGQSRKGYVLAMLAALVGRLVGRPVILSWRGGLRQEFFPCEGNRWIRCAYRQLFRLAGRVSCNSIRVKQAIERYGIEPEKVAAIPAFSSQHMKFQPTRLSPEITTFLETHHRVFFCYVSFRPEYNLPILREAMATYQLAYPDAGFVWLGFTSKEMPAVNEYVRQWPEQERQGLLLLGNLPHSEFLTLLSRCFAYIRTPVCDGVASSVLESLALGIPVVASDNGSRPNAVVTYREEDPSDLHTKIAMVTEQYQQIKKRTHLEAKEDNVGRTVDWLLSTPGRQAAKRHAGWRMFGRYAWIARISRVAEMSRHEIRVRATQEIAKRWDLAVSKMHIRALTNDSASPFGGHGQFFFQLKDVPGILAWVRGNILGVPEQIIGDADRILQHRFDLLGYKALDYGEEIDWHLDAVHGKSSPRVPWFRVPYLDFDCVGDHKVIWELNRHQHLVTLAKAYRLTENNCYADELFRQWYEWHAKNPYPIGINWASSLEVAFRSLSWLWLWYLLEGRPVVPKRFAFDLSRALMRNARHIERYLSTYFAPNTHLLGEAVALFFIGTLSPSSPVALRWQQLGWRLILQEAQRQVLPDGIHFEHSIYYHVYALDFFLHARILAAANGVTVPATLDETIEKMLEALCTLRGTGCLPQFGDDDGGRVFDPHRNHRAHMLDPLAIGSALFRRPDFKQAADGVTEEMVWLLGTNAAESFGALARKPVTASSLALGASGIYVMCGSGATQQQLVIDAGRQGAGWAGHGHADALSVQLTESGKPVLIDPGTFTYTPLSGDRNRFRETCCHNTVQVDGVSQAEPAGPFKWVSLAHAVAEHWVTAETFDFFEGSHAGYHRLPSPVLHRRCIFYLKPHFWLVRDVLEGAGTHQVDVSWNFAPGSLSFVPEGARFLGNDGARLTMLFAAHTDFDRQLLRSWYSPCYGRKLSAPRFCVRAKVQLPIECATVLIPNHKNNTRLEIISVRTSDRSTGSVRGYRLSMDHKSHEMFFSDVPGNWTTGRLSSDARFLYCAITSAGDVDQFALCDGTYLEAERQRVFSRATPVAKKEWRSAASMSAACRSVIFQEDYPAVVPDDSEQRARIESGIQVQDVRLG